jgi:putative hydrolase of the HAD superfamily
MVTTILFDYGGVFGSEAHDWGGTLQPVSNASGLSVGEMEGLWHEAWPSLVIGAHDLGSFWNSVSQASPTRPEPHALQEVFESAISENRDVRNIAEELKRRGFRLALVSNESRGGMNAKIQKFRLADLFEKVYCSANMGISKPDPALFSYILSDTKTGPREAILIDDQEANIKVAREIGMEAIHFKNAAQLRTELERFFRVSFFN